ncbi:hypothetical protein BGY98DRAFT_1178418 [Russula aff. rugulosa BPL654]|nr:hypothetical protein BGY98DRAFT_1178418 [Russula aff. rugulosa BPL654]
MERKGASKCGAWGCKGAGLFALWGVVRGMGRMAVEVDEKRNKGIRASPPPRSPTPDIALIVPFSSRQSSETGLDTLAVAPMLLLGLASSAFFCTFVPQVPQVVSQRQAHPAHARSDLSCKSPPGHAAHASSIKIIKLAPHVRSSDVAYATRLSRTNININNSTSSATLRVQNRRSHRVNRTSVIELAVRTVDSVRPWNGGLPRYPDYAPRHRKMDDDDDNLPPIHRPVGVGVDMYIPLERSTGPASLQSRSLPPAFDCTEMTEPRSSPRVLSRVYGSYYWAILSTT